MNDFTKCMGLNCPIKHHCMRYTEREVKSLYGVYKYDEQTKYCQDIWTKEDEEFYTKLYELTKPSN